MPTLEHDALMQCKRSDGGYDIFYPVTHKDNILGLEDFIKEVIEKGGNPMFPKVMFKTPGTHNWAVPDGVKWVKVLMIGGGGGGSGSGTGGPSGFIEEGIFDVSGLTSVAVTVGAGGAKFTVSPFVQATSGGLSSFGTFLSAKGGNPAGNIGGSGGGSGGSGSAGEKKGGRGYGPSLSAAGRIGDFEGKLFDSRYSEGGAYGSTGGGGGGGGWGGLAYGNAGDSANGGKGGTGAGAGGGGAAGNNIADGGDGADGIVVLWY